MQAAAHTSVNAERVADERLPEFALGVSSADPQPPVGVDENKSIWLDNHKASFHALADQYSGINKIATELPCLPSYEETLSIKALKGFTRLLHQMRSENITIAEAAAYLGLFTKSQGTRISGDHAVDGGSKAGVEHAESNLPPKDDREYLASVFKEQLEKVGGADMRDAKRRALDIVEDQRKDLNGTWGRTKLKYCLTHPAPKRLYFSNDTVSVLLL